MISHLNNSYVKKFKYLLKCLGCGNDRFSRAHSRPICNIERLSLVKEGENKMIKVCLTI